jgi:CBS domain-containing protein
MRAIDLAEQIPTVTRETTGAEAVRIVAEYRLSGLVVAGADGVPVAVIPGTQLLGLVLPQYVVDDPNLAHTFGESDADELCARLTWTTLAILLDSGRVTPVRPAAVRPEATLLEVASAMAHARLPVLTCTEADGTYRGAIMLSRVLAAIAVQAGEDSVLLHRRLDRDLIRRGEPWLPGDASATAGADPSPAGADPKTDRP